MSKEIPLGPWPHREWNPILGCTMVDHTCRNCYAAARARLADANHVTIRCDGPRTFWTGKVLHAPKLWDMPLRERKPCVVFAFSQADLFHPGVSDELRDRAFSIMHRCPHLQFNLLTKRVEIMRDYITSWCERRAGKQKRSREPQGRASTQPFLLMCDDQKTLMVRPTRSKSARGGSLLEKGDQQTSPSKHSNIEDQKTQMRSVARASDQQTLMHVLPRQDALKQTYSASAKLEANVVGTASEGIPEHCPLPNVRIGLSAGTQKHLDARWPFLRDTPAASRHLSLQPLLEPITLPADATAENLDWVVIMREVGPGARPMCVEWVSNLRSQCDARGIPFFWETTEIDVTGSLRADRGESN